MTLDDLNIERRTASVPTDADRVRDALDVLTQVREFHSDATDKTDPAPALVAVDRLCETLHYDQDLAARLAELAARERSLYRPRKRAFDALDVIDEHVERLAKPRLRRSVGGRAVSVPIENAHDRIPDAVETIRAGLNGDLGRDGAGIAGMIDQ